MRKNVLSLLMVMCFIPVISVLNSCGEKAKPDQQNTDEMATTNVREIPIEDFFKNPEKTSYKISPNGDYYSYMAPYEKRMNVFVQKIGSDSVIRITSETDRDIAGYGWANEGRIIYLKDNGGDENYKLYAVNLDGSNSKCLTDFDGVRTEFIDRLEDIPSEVIVGLNKRDKRVFDPYRLNIETGELTMLAENPGTISDWLTDHEGKLRLAVETDGVNTSILYRTTEKDEFKKVLTTNFKEKLNPLFFTFDNKNLYASSNLGRDKSVIVIFDPETGKETDTLFSNEEVDVDYLSYSKKRKVLTTATYITDKVQKHFFDEDMKKIFNRLQTELTGYEVGIASSNKAENKFIVKTSNDRTRGTYYFYDLESDKLEKIHDISPWLKEEELAEMKPVKYQSRDGKTIHGYLTLPLGKEAKNLPVVVNPHGGPWVRDVWGFNSEVQMLANKGFAVLQMNYRGSTGYGKEFWEISFKQWGRTMQDDITDGVNWLIEQGIADKDRVAIYGGSYGGYATLAGLTLTPDVYACGVDYVGVSNMFTFYNTIPAYWENYKKMLYEMAGDPVADSVMLREVSPVYHADKIKAPLFIAQGAKDPRVNIDESNQMVEALKKRGVEVEYLVKENEGHGFRNEENRFEFYRAMSSFLIKHIGDKK